MVGITSNFLENSVNNSIRTLPEFLINQIKAGEVVERPASLIKELLENSVDANSNKIEIHLVDNGLELISIIDNGTGIPQESLNLAFKKHSTSKISAFEDLFDLHTYGFRGEALASIASISRLTCTSQPKGEAIGGKIIIHGGHQQSLVPFHSDQTGTSIYVKDIFYNTPARLNFIKSKQSEKNSLKKILNYFLLTQPSIEFKIQYDEQEKSIFPPVKNISSRIQKLFFKKNENNKELWHIKKEYEDHQVELIASHKTSKGNAGKQHYLFVNNRLIEDKRIHQNVMHSLGNHWSQGESGHYVLFITAPPNMIDINVHPNKIQIKFSKENLVHSLISASIKSIHSKKENSSDDILITSREPNIPIGRKDFSSSQSLLPHQTPSSESYDNNNFSVITNNFVIKFGAPSILLSKNLILESISNALLKNTRSETTPLLVGEPIEDEILITESQLEMLSERGIEIDRISKEMLILKSIPTNLQTLPFLPIIKYLLMKIVNDVQSPSIHFTNEHWKSLIDENSIQHLGIPLTDDFLEKLIK